MVIFKSLKLNATSVACYSSRQCYLLTMVTVHLRVDTISNDKSTETVNSIGSQILSI